MPPRPKLNSGLRARRLKDKVEGREEERVLKMTEILESTIPATPAMPDAESNALKEAMLLSRCYAEYGAGGSTVAASSANIPDVICTESDAAWLQGVQRKVSEVVPDIAGKLHFIHVDIGPTKEWGYPASEAQWRHWPRYPLKLWAYCKYQALVPDLVLVDGRFRKACFYATLLHAMPGCRIFFDDYRERPHYHSIEKFISQSYVIGRMAVFNVSNSFSERLLRDALWQELLESINDTR
jgi:hypothetical protein